MSKRTFQTILIVIGAILALWIGFRYLFAIALPFLLGGAIAAGGEPIVKFLQTRLRLPRWAASGISITLTLGLLCGVVVLLAALVLRELSALSGAIPALTETAQAGLVMLEDWLLGMADRAPDGLRPGLIQGVRDIFSGGSALLEKAAGWALGLASGILGVIPDGLLGIGTMVLSAYMISGKYPAIRQKLSALAERHSGALPALSGLKDAVLGWLKAQLKLSGLTFCVTAAGFALLGISRWPLWAAVTAVVDAVPLLGTGTVLLPWSLVSLIQGRQGRALGLLGTYLAAALLRTTMEPRLVGRQLGLDPLVTLLALYAGYRLWGIGGMILSPLLAVTVTRLAQLRNDNS